MLMSRLCTVWLRRRDIQNGSIGFWRLMSPVGESQLILFYGAIGSSLPYRSTQTLSRKCRSLSGEKETRVQNAWRTVEMIRVPLQQP